VLSDGACIAFSRLEQTVTVTVAAVRGIHCQQPHVRAVIARNRGDDPDRRVTPDHRGLLGSKQRELEFGPGGRIADGPLTQRNNGVECVAVEERKIGHGAVTVPGIEVSRSTSTMSWNESAS
jgi:hypothetical protein